MPFITAVPDDQATGAVATMYEADRQVFGHLPNFTEAFSLRPDVYAAWRQLNRAIKANMDLRRYELATIAAAKRLRSSYCTLAHGSVLLDKFLSADDLHAVVGNRDNSELDAVDAAVIALADKVALDATSVMQSALSA
jgi:alkylhydroperoxidase family enzyme